MEEAEKTRRRLPVAVVVIAGVILLMVLASLYALWRIDRSLYRERLDSAQGLVEKIGQNVETGLSDHWDMAAYLAREFYDGAYTEMRTAKQYMAAAESRLEGEDQLLLLADSEGRCYASDGVFFQLPEPEVLDGDVFITPLPALGRDDDHAVFSVALTRPRRLGSVRITHLCLACSMQKFDEMFSAEYHDDHSAAFILRADGTQVYRQTPADGAPVAEEVLPALDGASFRYGGSAAELRAAVAAGRADCQLIQYRGEGCFAGCRPLDVNDWAVMVLLPEKCVGEGSFSRTVAFTVGGAALAVLAVLVAVLVSNFRRVRRQKAELRRRDAAAAKAMADANEAKTRLLTSMSHDIRTPMNAIIGMSTIAQKHLDDPEHIKDCLRKVSLASNHLLTLVNEVLDITKVEAGKMVLNPVMFSLAELANDLAGLVRTRVKEKNQVFEMHLHDITDEYFYADELRINQVYLNLLLNAVEFTPDGGSITVDLTEKRGRQPDTVQLIYTVSDTGVGMPPEFQAVMYESFSRAEDDRISKAQGTGLGLAICKRVTELMGGTIRCVSAENRGTTFTVTLELPIADKVPEPLKLPALNILLVDDNGLFLESAAATLQAMGAHADRVCNGLDALDKLYGSSSRYDVIIVDWKMPLLDGVETIRQLRSRLGESAPLMLLSAYDWTETETAARRAGADGFINKPFFPSTIYHSLNTYLHFDETEIRPENADGRDLAGMRLLIAEDNDLNWEIIREMMELYEITTHRAENGKACVEQIEAVPDGAYDLILMDVQMPVMDGREATRVIRRSQREWVREIPIIAMTADTFAEDIQACLDAGMNSHVAKPVDLKRLFRELRRARRGEFSQP